MKKVQIMVPPDGEAEVSIDVAENNTAVVDLRGGTILEITGEFVVVEVDTRRFVNVAVAGVQGTWTYEDNFNAALEKGDVVLVPFGVGNREVVGTVTLAGVTPMPSLLENGQIKTVASAAYRDEFYSD